MGTYTDLTVANYPLITSKSEVVPEAMTVFRETDRRVFTRRVKTGSKRKVKDAGSDGNIWSWTSDSVDVWSKAWSRQYCLHGDRRSTLYPQDSFRQLKL